MIRQIAGKIDEATAQTYKHGFEPQQFQQKAAKINAIFDRELGFAASAYRITTRGKKPDTRYGLAIDPSAIALG